MIVFARLMLAPLSALLLAGCGVQAQPSGREPALPRIVSLNPCTDAIVAEVAAPGQVLALSHYSRDPAASSLNVSLARSYGVTGGTVEEVLALDPDIVLAGAFLPPATRQALERLGMRVESYGIAQDVPQSVAQVRALARVIGRDARGERLARRIEQSARPMQGVRPVSTVLWQQGGIVPGQATLVNDLMHRAGLSSHSAARGLGQADYLPLEEVLADPPELLLVAGHERAQQHPALRQVRGMRIETFDPGLLYCGGPTIPRAMVRLKAVRG